MAELYHPAFAASGRRARATADRRRRQRGPAAEGAMPAAAPDPFVEHYFKRLDPELAASFTPAQRDAIRVMFGARGVAHHAIELRRSIPFLGGRRFYLVFLMGRERRGLARIYSQGCVSRPFNVLFYGLVGGLLAGLVIVPVLMLSAALGG
ncbi:MAG: hypothetical protein PVG24_13080 [Gammaproteobacteria bacterium]